MVQLRITGTSARLNRLAKPMPSTVRLSQRGRDAADLGSWKLPGFQIRKFLRNYLGLNTRKY